MKNIEVKVLNPEVIQDAEKLMVAMARLTQSGHKVSTMQDVEALIERPYTDKTANTMVDLPHPTIQKFGVINVMIVGLSRRALGQITRHQNETKFMSSSLQYSDYSGYANYVVPYEVTVADKETPKYELANWHESQYLNTCRQSTAEYEAAIRAGVPHDAASYQLPQGLRGVLLVSATPYQFKHMIRQRTCLRNTLETQYIYLKIWEELYDTSALFNDCGPLCTHGISNGVCPEGHMFCGEFPVYASPTHFLDDKFKYIR